MRTRELSLVLFCAAALAVPAAGASSPTRLTGEEEPRKSRRSARERVAESKVKSKAEIRKEKRALLERLERAAKLTVPDDLPLEMEWSVPLKREIRRVWVQKDMVLLLTGSKFIQAIRRADGVALWTLELAQPPQEIDPVVTAVNVYVVVGSYLLCIDKRAGKILWRLQPEFPISCTPVVREPDVYVGGWDRKFYSVEIKRKLRTFFKGRTEEESLVDYEYSLAANWYITTKAHVVAPAVLAYGFLYFGCEDKYLYAVNLDGELRYRFETQAPIRSSPAAMPNRLYVGSTDYNLYSLDRLTGEKKWHFPTGDEVLKKPYADYRDKLIYVPSYRHGAFAINDATGRQAWPWRISDGYKLLGVSKHTVYFALRPPAKDWRDRVIAVDKRTGVARWLSLLGDPMRGGFTETWECYNDWTKPNEPMRLFLTSTVEGGNSLVCLKETREGVGPVPFVRAKAREEKAEKEAKAPGPKVKIEEAPGTGF